MPQQCSTSVSAPKVRPEPPGPDKASRQVRLFIGFSAVLLLCFSKPLYLLARLALADELYNYILLVPFVSAYFAWTRRSAPVKASGSWTGALPLAVGLGLSAVYWLLPHAGPPEDRLFYGTLAWLFLFIGGWIAFLGPSIARQFAFPLGFLFFTVPIPAGARDAIETFLQHGSASLANALFVASNTTFLHDDLTFQFTGFALHVAPECSGIRSTLVLLVLSVVAAQVLLQRPSSRLLLCAVVVPLGIFRNAIRIFTLGQLCIHISPDMLDSYIHHRGGPVFFLAALVPFFLLLWVLRRFERRGAGAAAGQAAVLT